MGGIRLSRVAPSDPGDPLPLQYLKGVGPVRAKHLAAMGIVSNQDLIRTYPRDWQDRRHRFSLREAPIGEKTSLIGQISSVHFSTIRQNLGIAIAMLKDDSGEVPAVWFKRINPRYDVFASLRQRLQNGLWIMVFGSVEWGIEGRQIRAEEMAILTSDRQLPREDSWHLNRITPLYTTTEGISERFFRSLIARILPGTIAELSTVTPTWIQQKYQSPDLSWALQTIHFPQTLLDKERAREYLAFEEFLMLEVALGLVRQNVKRTPKMHTYQLRRHLLTPFREHMGFTFTQAQKRVIKEIFDDMMNPLPMNRLMQGDVGSGKTIVALSAMLLAVENGGQAALMAPTEILAEQHGSTLARFLEGLPLQWAVLTSRQTSAHRTKILQKIAAGQVNIVIGTHALIQRTVQFQRLMLAVIDEQHRFGVEHRALLREKGNSPDVLVMTATPIPRTLALTIYGDLDISVLNELPPGRTPVHTIHISEEEAYTMIHREISHGRQAYVVYPLVEESDKVELKAAVQEAHALCQKVFKNLRVGVLHGQMPGRDKEVVMSRFRTGQLDILIATSIVEVGIDVPNATVMLIQHAERFGLSTLHQLRGRVGRGPHVSYCLLVANTRSEDAQKRISIMTSTTDGFRVSEEDLQLRGPGEVLGVQQHGLPVFKIGHLLHDARLIQQARNSAEDILKKDPRLKQPAHHALRVALDQRYAEKRSFALTS